ncbi:ABC transporter permease [Albibacterium bauzanense]|uniref:Putative ABC transport system permease protein n=1 Tax=Albibacterium bauzanense TaxID=653929 RepID=A0A4R1M1I9_9SPHI|nr:ABC transporter permease [Albibacterium bauzanense]TCK85838.1 putative ABC transport system permease protein [Albibacterium bauzanense]
MDFYLTALLQGLCLSGIALGIYISMKIFNIPDITTDGSYTLGGAVTGMLLSNHLPIGIVLPVVIIAGGLAGVFTGLIHTKLKINPLLSGILVMTGLYSINLSIMGRSNIPLLNYTTLFDSFHFIADLNWNSLIVLLFIGTLLILLIGYILKSDYGITMRATGNSEKMVSALGVNIDRIKIVGLGFANALTAVSGFLMTQFQGFTDINMGIGIVIVGLGSVIIADTFINWMNISSIWISLILVCLGAILFQLVLAFTLSIGIDPTLLKLITALFVLSIVSLPRLNLTRN